MTRGLLPSVALASLIVLACEPRYCQVGPKSGTQCYEPNEIEHQETVARSAPPPAPIRPIQPSPGCWLATPSGIVTAPSAGAPAIPPPYLMSGACVSQRQPVHAAIH